jgi:sodium/bile acid cotransporter 7
MPLPDAVLDIMTTLLLPFIAGQLCRPLLLDWLVRCKPVTGMVDKGVIVLIVLSSFSDSSMAGVWSGYPPASLLVMALVVIALLTVVLAATLRISRALGFSRADELAAVFCGSKKSLANGMPMANIIFAGQPGLGVIVLPMMIYHQFQLLVCSVMAQRYAATEHDLLPTRSKTDVPG